MDLSELVKELSKLKANLGSVDKLLKEIERLNRDQTGNIQKIKGKLVKLEQSLKELGSFSNYRESFDKWIGEYKSKLSLVEAEIKRN